MWHTCVLSLVAYTSMITMLHCMIMKASKYYFSLNLKKKDMMVLFSGVQRLQP